MEVHIGELVSTVRAVDGDALLTPQTLQKIVEVVLKAIDDRDGHRRRVDAERRVSDGVRGELEGEER